MNTVCVFFNKPWPYVIVIILGIALKFYHLNHRIFWQDEISTVLYTSGQSEKELVKRIPNQIINIKYYDSLLHPLNGGHSITSEIKQIFSDTHLTPAHYVFLSVWYRLVGDSATDFRLFSVFIYLLCLPFLFLLIKKLSGNSLYAWITTSLFSVSPFISFHAQEARYYILWVLVFILSNYIFLLTISKNKLVWWVAYSIVSIVALYTTLLSGLIIIGHLLYILFFHKELRKQFFLSVMVVALAYSPWLYFLFSVRTEIQDGLSWQVRSTPSFFSLKYLFYQLIGWSRSFNYLADSTHYVFLFWGIRPLDDRLYLALIIDIIVLVLVLYAIKYFLTNNKVSTSWLLVFLTLPTFLLFYISDSVRGGFISAMWRYHVVNMVGIIIIVAYFLKDKISRGNFLWIGCYVGLAVLCIGSIMKFQKSRTWFLPGQTITHISQVIDQTSHPLVVTDLRGDGRYGLVYFMSALKEIKSQNVDILYHNGYTADIANEANAKRYSDILVVLSSDKLIKKFKADYGERMSVLNESKDGSGSIVWRIR